MIYKLLNTYEIFIDVSGCKRPVRVDVFESLEQKGMYRGRVWDQTTYNQYPTGANMEEGKGIVNRVFSSDEINREITNILAEEAEFITGKYYPSEGEFLSYVVSLVKKYESLCN